jgi:hypothetical protein
MNRIDKAALQGWAIVVIASIIVGGAAWLIAMIPAIYWQTAWAMVKGAVPFAIAITIAVWINQKFNH